MLGVFDQEMFDAGWAELTLRLTALALHSERLRCYPVQLLWRDELEAVLYQNESLRRDVVIAVSGVLEYLRGNGRLRFPALPVNVPRVIPPLGDSLNSEVRDVWLGLLGNAATDIELGAQGFGIFTWQRQNLCGMQSIRVLGSNSADVDIPLIRHKEEWDAFLLTYHKPDLSTVRVAILGGKRAPIERARQELVTYGLTELRWLPPSREERRSQADTLSRLQNVDLLVVCTDLVGHSDTDHIKGVSLPCERRDVHNHSTTSLVQEVLAHFRIKL